MRNGLRDGAKVSLDQHIDMDGSAQAQANLQHDGVEVRDEKDKQFWVSA